MYEVIGIDYERRTAASNVIRKKGRTPEILQEVYSHGKSLWDSGTCSKYLIVLVFEGRVVDYHRPDRYNFDSVNNFKKAASRFSEWDYRKGLYPFTDGLSDLACGSIVSHMCERYAEIMAHDGVTP